MALSISATRAYFEALRSLAFGSISGSYAALGTKLLNPARIIKIVNTTDADVLISVDGTADHDIVPAGGFFLYDLTTNHAGNLQGFYFPQGTQFYVKQVSAPTSGSVYLTVVYGLALQP